MNNYQKYVRQYFMPPKPTYDWVRKDHIDKAPIWCSVDLRDGNQALIEPMSLEEKLEFFEMLIKIGFKEIEIGFPAASDTEYKLCRTLIEKHMIPDDVTIQVLTQAREHIIKKTFEAIEGAPHAIVHLYNSTSVAQREQVFHKDKDEIRQIAIDGAKLLVKLTKEAGADYSYEYSPESFPGTEVDYALDVCNAVLDVFKPAPEKKVVINIPTTVENSMSHVFATQIEYINKNIKYRDGVTISLHPHNDRGCGVCDAELGLLAGADRIEGTLFGNGERTGNVDIVTLAMNLFSHGVDPKLDFSNMPAIASAYERLTRMNVYDRSPYAGNLVFTAFSGSHQDAIAKGFAYREKNRLETWTVPYLPIDPHDVGRQYDGDVIRINSQSGKGGISYILKTNYDLIIPKQMQEDVGYTVKGVSDREHKELSPEEIFALFNEKYVNNCNSFSIPEFHFKQVEGIQAELTILANGVSQTVTGRGNGRLDAVSHVLQRHFNISYDLVTYEEHALTRSTSSKAVCYVCINSQGTDYWGVGIHEDIINASVYALVSAVNQLDSIKALGTSTDDRYNEIMKYIRDNYLTVTLSKLAEKFFLSQPYISKYIKEKSGMTFEGHVKKLRLDKAGSLLRNGNMKVANIAESVGYQNVEHFNRLFKAQYGVTPVQYRNQK